MAKHNTFPGKQPEMPAPGKLPEIKHPNDLKVPQIPEDNSQPEPEDLPRGVANPPEFPPLNPGSLS